MYFDVSIFRSGVPWINNRQVKCRFLICYICPISLLLSLPQWHTPGMSLGSRPWIGCIDRDRSWHSSCRWKTSMKVGWFLYFIIVTIFSKMLLHPQMKAIRIPPLPLNTPRSQGRRPPWHRSPPPPTWPPIWRPAAPPRPPQRRQTSFFVCDHCAITSTQTGRTCASRATSP